MRTRLRLGSILTSAGTWCLLAYSLADVAMNLHPTWVNVLSAFIVGVAITSQVSNCRIRRLEGTIRQLLEGEPVGDAKRPPGQKP